MIQNSISSVCILTSIGCIQETCSISEKEEISKRVTCNECDGPQSEVIHLFFDSDIQQIIVDQDAKSKKWKFEGHFIVFLKHKSIQIPSCHSLR